MRTLYFYHELEDMYEEKLNECYETVIICGYTYESGHALRLLDKTAFHCLVSDWVYEEFNDLKSTYMTDAEIEYYMVNSSTTMYCRKNENF